MLNESEKSRSFKFQVSSFKLFFTCILYLVSCIPFFISDAHAARPLVTEDAVLAGKGVSQLEVGVDYTKVRDKGEGTALLITPIHGVTEDTEFYLKLPYIYGRPGDPSNVEGWGDISFYMKHLFAEESNVTPAAAVRMAIKIPSGDKGKELGTGDTNVGFLGVFTKNIGLSTIHLNVGFTFVGDQKDRYNNKNEVNYGIAGEYGIWKKTRLVGEVYGLYLPDYKAAEIERRGLLGITYRLNDTFTFDCAAKRGLGGYGNEYGFIAGVTSTF